MIAKQQSIYPTRNGTKDKWIKLNQELRRSIFLSSIFRGSDKLPNPTSRMAVCKMIYTEKKMNSDVNCHGFRFWKDWRFLHFTLNKRLLGRQRIAQESRSTTFQGECCRGGANQFLDCDGFVDCMYRLQRNRRHLKRDNVYVDRRIVSIDIWWRPQARTYFCPAFAVSMTGTDVSKLVLLC